MYTQSHLRTYSHYVIAPVIRQQILIVPEDRTALLREKKDVVTVETTRKGAREVVAETDIATETAQERGMVIEIVRGTKTDAVKEMKEDIALTDLVPVVTVGIVTENATVIAKEKIEIETEIVDEEGMTWMTLVKWKVAQRGSDQMISLMR